MGLGFIQIGYHEAVLKGKRKLAINCNYREGTWVNFVLSNIASIMHLLVILWFQSSVHCLILDLNTHTEVSLV